MLSRQLSGGFFDVASGAVIVKVVEQIESAVSCLERIWKSLNHDVCTTNLPLI